MKRYEDEKIKDISKATLRKLEKIAMDADFGIYKRGGIEARYNDEEDFPDVSILAIQEMLEQAYRLGRADGGKKA